MPSPQAPFRSLPGRSFFILLVVLLLWGVIIGRLFSLQVIDYDFYLEQAIDNVQRTSTVTGERGIIYDANGIQLAANYSVYRVFISPYDMVDRTNEEILTEFHPDPELVELISTGLSDILGVNKNTIVDLCQKVNRKDETIAKNIESDLADQVLAFIGEYDLDQQVHLEASTKRYYPSGSLAAHVIGVVGTDGGLIGLEMQYDEYLAGTTIKYLSAKDSLGLNMPFKYDSYLDASGGANLHLTLDANIQHILEQQLASTYADSAPLNRATAIAVNPTTGAVLGMATYPSFDLNDPYTLNEEMQAKLDATGYPSEFILDEALYRELNLDRFVTPGKTAQQIRDEQYNEYRYYLIYAMWRNKAVSELYEPGSTFKCITTALALEENVATLDSTFYCRGFHVVPGYPERIHCHITGGHGTLTLAGALQESCNPAMMMLSDLLGRSTFYEYFKTLGYTEKTGIDLPGEASTVYHNFSSFYQTELAVYSFGQTFKVTPMRQLSSVCAVANGGYLVQPYIVEQIVDDNGTALYTHQTKILRQVLSSKVCATVSDILEKGVSGDGGARNAYVPGYKIAAKTGTSEIRDVISDPETGARNHVVGSTVAYAPSDDPKIAIIMVVDTPIKLRPGSVVAAPYIANIMNEVLPYLGVERSYTEEELKKLAVNIHNYTGWTIEEATKALRNLDIDYEVVGFGDQVSFQIPAGGSALSKEHGKVILYTGSESPVRDVTVPVLTGMTLTAATRTLLDLGLNVSVKGAENGSAGAVVVSQDVAAQSLVPKGTLVTITLRYLNDTDH